MLHRLRLNAVSLSKRANAIHKHHNSLCHGDFHSGNVMFRPADKGPEGSVDGLPSVQLIDWQVFVLHYTVPTDCGVEPVHSSCKSNTE